MWKTYGVCFVLSGCAHSMDDGDPMGASRDASPEAAPMELDAGVDSSTSAEASDEDTGALDAGAEAEAGPTERYVFVTSNLYTGNLGGLAGADAKCQGLATAANLPGTYKAWLSDSQWWASARLTHSKVPYVLVDETLVASDWFALTSGTLKHAIDLTEKGQPPSVGTYKCGSDGTVWSNTTTSGAAKTNDCSDWMSSADTTPHAGSFLYTSWAWTDYCQLAGAGECAKTAALYCFQQ